MRNVFVTGPDGLLGSNLVRELVARNYHVVAMIQKGRNPVTLDGLPIQKVYGDITCAQEVEDLSSGSEYLIHVAALTDTWPSRGGKHYLINVEGTKNVIRAALKNGTKRLVHVGSAGSFGYGDFDNPGDETSPYKSYKYKIDYTDSKRDGQLIVEEAAKKDGLPAIIVCPTFMIGPYDVKPSSGALVLALAKGKLPALPVGGRNWVAVKDVAVATSNALVHGRVGESYILGGENLTYKDAVKKMAQAIELKDYPQFVMPDLLLKTMGLFSSALSAVTQRPPKLSYPMACVACDHHYFSPRKAIDELGMPQTPIEHAAKELHDWFRENNYL
jgi:dihydroflavonol-4-reductase